MNAESGSDYSACGYPDSPYETIGRALSLARDSNTILVAAGTYTSTAPLTITKPVKLLGGRAADTWQPCHNHCTGFCMSTIDCAAAPVVPPSEDALRLIRFDEIRDGAAILEGFTITNAKQGGILVDHESHVDIRNSRITSNSGGMGGLHVVGGSKVTVTRSIIALNELTGLVNGANVAPTTHVDRSTIVYNGGPGILCGVGGLGMTNSIVWGNEGGSFHPDPPTNCGATYSDIGSDLPGEGNISHDPRFVDPEAGDYRLRYDSPCIGAGDPDSLRDPDGTSTDIGACYYWPHIYLPAMYRAHPVPVIHSSHHLDGHSIIAECNPAGATDCPCSPDEDAGLRIVPCQYGEVISNPLERHTYANAIAYKKFDEIFPDGSPIDLGVYRYSGWFRLPVLPSPDPGQRQNPENMHVMIQLWDGSNRLYPANDYSLEGSMYWQLNPWVDLDRKDEDKGMISVYTGTRDPDHRLDLADTGIRLLPDTHWRFFWLVVNLENQHYVSLSVRSPEVGFQHAQLSHVPLARVLRRGWPGREDWGPELSLAITTESQASYPQKDCSNIFTWATHFRDLEFRDP